MEKDKIKQEIETYQDACEESQATQTGKVSSISRSIIYGIIATNWFVISTGEKGFSIQSINTLLKLSLVFCFVYLVIDLTHYFIDALRYRIESFRLDNINVPEKFRLYGCKTRMNNISIWSFVAVACKYILTISTSIVFLIGLLQKFDII